QDLPICGETRCLTCPVEGQRRWANDQRAPAELPQECERLHRLTETHLVGEDAPQSVLREEVHPVDALLLVRAQHFIERSEGHALELLQIAARGGKTDPLVRCLERRSVLRSHFLDIGCVSLIDLIEPRLLLL